mmetsp:Transcript_11303/g.27254  ORF Transcript_11303/g.27254 Transcript_11303/m.27254 type:complete len:465 (+) Transcript_11303:752-2146(+)
MILLPLKMNPNAFPLCALLKNILTFTPPGFRQSLNVKFPDGRLAVCEKCKKNFKTKDMCRVRNGHNAPPWTTAYICITIDDACLDEEGKWIDRPMTVRMVNWRPYAVKKPFHPKTPVCSACKRTNRTRSFCRERHQHRQLPWCTVYVLLSPLDQADPSTVVAGASKPVEPSDEDSKSPPGAIKSENSPSSASDGRANGEKSEADTNGDARKGAQAADVASASSETISSDVDDQGDDINDIAEGRTFLAKVNSRGCSIHWLEIVEDDTPTPTYASPLANAYATPDLTPPHMDPSTAQAHYYAHAQYAQQQHQNALQSHQQYFFQMQQRQHQQYAQWQQQYAQQMAQGGEASLGATAGEAAAASHRRQGEGDVSSPIAAVAASPGQPSAAWPPMYYGAPAAGFYSPPGPPTATTPGPLVVAPRSEEAAVAAVPVTQEHYPIAGTAQISHSGENSEEEPDAKRHRTS